jgi:hypothetical protein
MHKIDHVLIFASIGAPEAERLIAFGLTEGSPNRHPGQGTANRRFFFDNATLELLWVENPEEAQSENGNPDRGREESSPWAYGQGKGRKRGWESSCHGHTVSSPVD